MTIFHGRKNLRHRLFNSPIGILLDGDLQDKYLIQSITGIERVYEAGLYEAGLCEAGVKQRLAGEYA